jgi:hypothetical protein
MDKKISSGFAITVIAIIAVVLTLFIWVIGARNNSTNQAGNKENAQVSETNANQENKCRRMFEGDIAVKAWLAEKPAGTVAGAEAVIKLLPEDIDKLPLPGEISDRSNFELKLVDADQKVMGQLENSSQKNPVKINLKGYKYFCDKMHLVSTKPAQESLKNI